MESAQAPLGEYERELQDFHEGMSMNDLPSMSKYIIHTQVVKVEEKFDKVHVEGYGGTATFRQQTKGWFVYLKGSYEALHLGFEKPDLAFGDKIKITLEKE